MSSDQICLVHASEAAKAWIKVFALCCDVSAIILAFKVYVGKEDDYDGSAVGICDGLVDDAGLTKARGRVLYTDNYYTSVKLAKLMYENMAGLL